MNLNDKKLQWACRRGMLELDVMLKPYLDDVYPSLDESQQAVFRRLLEQQDQNLFEWLTARHTPEDTELANMVKQIRSYAEHRER
ncbi:MAG: response regulator receiver protein [Legionellaceae bacterium]|nr:response regulator receiver protein [Legionellaceae bacterium]|tara:strand:+ start:1264 stop:1518 length:255 start_codon:yes stop_codon:yes gene_type:complete